jgi:hypothetical protein
MRSWTLIHAFSIGSRMKPLRLLSVDQPDPRAVVLEVRTDDSGVTKGKLLLPEWYEIPPMFDGPHTMDVAIVLADSYAEVYGYRAITIDIESSQLWDPA